MNKYVTGFIAGVVAMAVVMNYKLNKMHDEYARVIIAQRVLHDAQDAELLKLRVDARLHGFSTSSGNLP